MWTLDIISQGKLKDAWKVHFHTFLHINKALGYLAGFGCGWMVTYPSSVQRTSFWRCRNPLIIVQVLWMWAFRSVCTKSDNSVIAFSMLNELHCSYLTILACIGTVWSPLRSMWLQPIFLGAHEKSNALGFYSRMNSFKHTQNLDCQSFFDRHGTLGFQPFPEISTSTIKKWNSMPNSPSNNIIVVAVVYRIIS